MSGLSRAAVVVLLLAVVSCAGRGTEGVAGGSSAPSTTTVPAPSGQRSSGTALPTVSAPAPTTEQTGTLERPQQPASGQPAVEVAGLPVGGDAEVSASDPTALCVHVNWILQQTSDTIPAGLSVRLATATFAPAVFQPSAHGCDGIRVAPSCEQEVLTVDQLRCDLSVEPMFPALPFDGSEDQGSMSLAGSIQCPDYHSQTCRSFVRAVQEDPETISVPVPRPAGTSTESSATVPQPASPGSGGDGTTTTSTTPAGSMSSAPGG